MTTPDPLTAAIALALHTEHVGCYPGNREFGLEACNDPSPLHDYRTRHEMTAAAVASHPAFLAALADRDATHGLTVERLARALQVATEPNWIGRMALHFQVPFSSEVTVTEYAARRILAAIRDTEGGA